MAEQIQEQMPEQMPELWISKIFMLLHGRFGKQFLDKFSLLDERGEEIGIPNAKIVWAQALSGMTPDQIKKAIDANYKFGPPSCDQFRLAGIMDEESLFRLAQTEMSKRRGGLHGEWPSVQVFWAATRMHDNIHVLDYHKIEKIWQEALRVTAANFTPIPEPEKAFVAIEHKPDTNSDELRKAKQAKVRKIILGMMADLVNPDKSERYIRRCKEGLRNKDISYGLKQTYIESLRNMGHEAYVNDFLGESKWK